MVEMQFEINMSQVFFYKSNYSFRCFQSDGEFIPDPRHSDRESMVAQVAQYSILTVLLHVHDQRMHRLSAKCHQCHLVNNAVSSRCK